MKQLLVLIAMVSFVAPSFAGVNEGGVLVVHHDPQLINTGEGLERRSLARVICSDTDDLSVWDSLRGSGPAPRRQRGC
jgi:hypothetical protein